MRARARAAAGVAAVALAAAGLILAGGNAAAAPLFNQPVEVTQPDGTRLALLASGDEYYNWAHDAQGFTVVQDSGSGWWVYADRVVGRLVPTPLVVGTAGAARAGLERGLLDNPAATAAQATSAAAMRAAPASAVTRGLSAPAEAAALPQLQGPHSGTLNNLAIFVRFADDPEFSLPLDFFDSKFNSGAISMKGFYQEASYGALTVSTTYYPAPSGSQVLSYQDIHPRGYYQPYNWATNPAGYESGERALREHELVINTVAAVQPLIPTSLAIDSDGDGVVDGLTFVLQGGTGLWNSLLWPHESNMYPDIITINDIKVDPYVFQIEQAMTPAVVSHEMFHVLGAPDLYRYTTTAFQPVGPWDLMGDAAATPDHMGAWMKYRYGRWIASIPTITAPGTYTLHPLTSATNNAWRLASPNSPYDSFVLEYRAQDTPYEAATPGAGLVVYRIDSSFGGNGFGPPDEIYIFRPGGTPSAFGDITKAHFSQAAGRTKFDASTDPYPFDCGLYVPCSAAPGGIAIANVGAAGATISFDIMVGIPCTSCFVPVCPGP